MPAFDYPFGGPNGIQARSWTTHWIQIFYKVAKKFFYSYVFIRIFYDVAVQL